MNKPQGTPLTDEITRCPVQDGAEHFQELAHGLSRTLRRLRKDLGACRRCTLYNGCTVLQELNRQVSNAIDEITEEWSR